MKTNYAFMEWREGCQISLLERHYPAANFWLVCNVKGLMAH
jgi:hypothetical protein